MGRREVGALGDGAADGSRFLPWSLERNRGGVSYSNRGDEIVSFGSLKDMMKSQSHNPGSMQDPSGIWVKSVTLHTGFYKLIKDSP